MDLLKEIQNVKPLLKSTIDMLGAHLSKLEKTEATLLQNNVPSTRAIARKQNKENIMTDIVRLEGRNGKPQIAKKKRK